MLAGYPELPATATLLGLVRRLLDSEGPVVVNLAAEVGAEAVRVIAGHPDWDWHWIGPLSAAIDLAAGRIEQRLPAELRGRIPIPFPPEDERRIRLLYSHWRCELGRCDLAAEAKDLIRILLPVEIALLAALVCDAERFATDLAFRRELMTHWWGKGGANHTLEWEARRAAQARDLDALLALEPTEAAPACQLTQGETSELGDTPGGGASESHHTGQPEQDSNEGE